jgi:anthranilate phosphoribosyltransferase
LHPSDVHLTKGSPEELRGGDAAENARIAREVLAGKHGAARDIVLFNAAASLLIAGAAPTLADGIASAAAAIDSGSAAGVLDRLVRLSNTAAEVAGA